MKTTMMMAVAMVWAVPAVSYAFGGLDAVRSQALKSVTQNTVKDASCTDFSGNWKGTCTDSSGKTVDVADEIKQFGCEVILSGGQAIFIGGLHTGAEASTLVNYSESTSVNWNKDKSALKVNLQSFVQGQQGNAVPFNGTSQSEIVNGQLVETIEFANSKLVCTYSKL